ncbi:protoheme IX farnesyltransferase mitochondrial-like [Trifolium pratense]|uniref:Heme O synthase n=1 Tax=Trifolium pratense TaxID=57577 RepID=A0A2K3NPP7_TRIPR|nr:protoheme IX farnesyltransferase mitochondrial-like [Trifolium pratense]
MITATTMLRRNWNCATLYSRLVNSSSPHNFTHLRSSFSSSNLHLSSSVSTSKSTDLLSFVRHYGNCYSELSKARLSLLVVATSGTGFVLGSGGAVDLSMLSYTCLGTMMVAASASTLNQVFEIKNDAIMRRTSQRPLPAGRITIPHAVAWASSVGLAGTALLATQLVIWKPLVSSHLYDLEERAPPKARLLKGWAAASGDISLNSLILPAALYFWQIPHFMALAYMCRDDYAAGGFKMYSLADPSGRKTALVAMRNSIYLIPLGFLAYDCE